MSIRRSPLEQQRLVGVVRTTLITYGVAAFTYLFARHVPSSAEGVGGMASPQALVLGGLALQLALVVVRLLIKRYSPDQTAVVQGYIILELIGDGVTVLLFALSTLGAIMPGAGDI